MTRRTVTLAEAARRQAGSVGRRVRRREGSLRSLPHLRATSPSPCHLAGLQGPPILGLCSALHSALCPRGGREDQVDAAFGKAARWMGER